MDRRLENIFTNFANSQEESLKQMGMTKKEFVENAEKWSQSREGRLEIQKFILGQEINDLRDQIKEIEDNIEKKQASIKEIEEELSTLDGD